MARRKKTSGGEDLIDALARLPWHWCLILAATVWLPFHWMAELQPPAARNVAEMGNGVAVMIFKTAGILLQYLAPLVLLIAALVSLLRKRRRQALLFEAQSRSTSASLRTLSWRDFERLVGAHFEREGYAVSFTPDGADGGVDVIAKKGGETYLIQCKQWRASKVGVSVVRELFGVMSAQGATGGFVVSIGEFTEEAHAFARGRNLELVDANALIGTAAQVDDSRPADASRVVPGSGESCPQCGAAMVLRTAQRGTQKGKSFWGCSTFPRCRGTIAA